MTKISFTVPGTSLSLESAEHEMRSADGQHTYPVVNGVPVLLPRGGHPTFDAYLRSQHITDVSDDWQIDTLAIAEPLRERVRQSRSSGNHHVVDPAVSHLILATNGLAYAQFLGRLQQYPIPRLGLPPGHGKSLLDIGCSWGRWSASAAKLMYDVTGIDPSLGAVLAATRVFRQLGLEGTFVCGDGRLLPFPDESFDVVHSYSVLQHFSDDDARATWLEINRVLKPGGLALVQMANGLGIRSVYHLARRGFRRAKAFEVRYRFPVALSRLGDQHVGPSTLLIDCFCGLGLQNSDKHLYTWPARCAVALSEFLKKAATVIPPIKLFADSLYVQSVKNCRVEESAHKSV